MSRRRLSAVEQVTGVAPAPVTIKAPAYADQALTRSVERVLRRSSKFHRAGITALLEDRGVSEAVVASVLRLVAGGTATRPNAILRGHALDYSDDLGIVQRVRDLEVYSRAQFVVNSATRLQRAVDEGRDLRAAIATERRYAAQHEAARRGRLVAAAQVQSAANTYGWTLPEGTLVGWYLNPLLNNDEECIAAAGHNFIAEQGTTIGLPGSVHPNCGCFAGPPHPGARMVNVVVSKIKHFHGPKVVPLRRKESA